MHAILTSFGSTGDLLPLLAVGQGLADRGHRVTVAAGGGFAAMVEDAGLEFFPVCSAAEHARSIEEVAVLASRFRGIFFRKYVVGWNRTLLRFLADEDHGDVVCVSAERPTVWADLCAHAHFRIPCIRLGVDLPGAREGRMFADRVQAMLLEIWQRDWQKAAWREGVAVGSRHIERLYRATAKSVPRFALWPDWFVSPTFARNIPRIGFLGSPSSVDRGQKTEDSHNQSTVHRLPSTAHRRQILFIAGSIGTTARWDHAFAAISRNVCAELGSTGLMLGGEPPLGSAERERGGSRSFTWKKFVPLDEVLPSAAAIVHHGGVGTIAAALKAGVPQLIVPRVFGQAANADCARRLGVAAVMSPEAYSVSAASAGLNVLLSNPTYRRRSEELSARIDTERDTARVCDLIESARSRIPNTGSRIPNLESRIPAPVEERELVCA